MRLLRLTTLYPSYVKRFYAVHPELATKSYAEQKAALDYDAFGWADFWKNALNPLGYELMEVPANVESLQKAWALENGVSAGSPNWMLDIAREQVKSFQPDILFLDDYATFTYSWITELKQACPSIRLTLGWCGAPFNDPTVFKAYDIVLSCIPELVEKFRQMGHRSEHLNHAFEPRILSRVGPSSEPTIDISFVGSIVRGNRFHGERERLLERLVQATDVQLFTPGAAITRSDEVKTMLKQTLYNTFATLRAAGVSNRALSKLPVIGKAGRWEEKPVRQVNSKLVPYMKPAVFGLAMYRTLINSKATFNNHIDISPRSASNMRLFEATGVGTCLLTDWKENLSELFEVDKEVVAYRSADECVEKAMWLLDNSRQREEIAAAGQARTLRDHTFSQRAARLDCIIKEALTSNQPVPHEISGVL